MLRRTPRPLALLLAVAALLSVGWTFGTAPFQGPDEPAHFNYAQYLAETGKRPSVTQGTHPDSTGVGAALNFLHLDQLAGVGNARPAWGELEEQRFERVLRAAGEEADEDGAGPNPLAKNPPLYYAYEAVPYMVGSLGSFWDRLTLMRLASGVLYLIAVAFAWFAAAEAFAATWPRLMAAGSVALLPQMTALSGTVNADNLLVAAWSAFFFFALRLARRGPSTRLVLGLCAAAAASLLTHGRGIAIAIPLAGTLALALLLARPSPRQALRWLAPGVALLVVAFGVYRFLLTPETGAYGGEVTLSSARGMTIKGFLNVVWQFYLPPLPFMDPPIGPDYGYRQVFIESFFGRFATLEVGFPGEVYTLIQAACAIGLAGLVATIAGRWAEVRERWPQVAVALLTTASMIGLLHLASYRSLVGTLDPLITGRYLLPVIVGFGLAIAFVVSSLPARAGALVGGTVLGGLLVLNLSGLLLTLTRFYG